MKPHRLGLTLTGLLAACQAVPEPRPVPPPPAPVATPSPTPAPAPLPPAAISYDGELTQGGFIRGTLPPNTVAAALDGESFPFAPDGTFFAAFDLDAPAQAKLTARLSDGRTI